MTKFTTQLDIKEGINTAKIPSGTFSYIHGFSVLSISDGKEIELDSDGNEVGIVLFSGSCDVEIAGKLHRDIGARKQVFSGLPWGIYIPVDTRFRIIGKGAELGICSARCNTKTNYAVIPPENIKVAQVGKNNWQREVRTIISDNVPSVNLILGETINPPGNWSGTPPHKHEKIVENTESLHEELYYFKSDKDQGFGIERLYFSDGKEEFIPLRNNTVTFMPHGYHQIVVGPGYAFYYLFFLAGEGKKLVGYPDPQHKWIIE